MVGGFAPAGDQAADPIGEDRHHRQHRAHLDQGVEEIRVVAASQAFRDEQVTGGGDGQELGDAFNDAEQCGEEPFRHGEEWGKGEDVGKQSEADQRAGVSSGNG